MESEKYEYFKQKLLSEKEAIEKHAALRHDVGLDKSFNESIGELSGYDNHPADIGTEMFERGKDIALEENNEHILQLIDESLDKIEQGTYGYCEECKKEISIERLEAIPYAKYCLKHQGNHEGEMTTRPVEEEILNPPFGKTEFYDKDDDTDYDDLFIETDESEGYVEELEGFIITDMDGNATEENVDFVKNKAYEEYMKKHEK